MAGLSGWATVPTQHPQGSPAVQGTLEPKDPAVAEGPRDPPVNTRVLDNRSKPIYRSSLKQGASSHTLLCWLCSHPGSIPAPSPSHLWVLAICIHPSAWPPTGKSLCVCPNCIHKLMSLLNDRVGRDPLGSHQPPGSWPSQAPGPPSLRHLHPSPRILPLGCYPGLARGLGLGAAGATEKMMMEGIKGGGEIPGNWRWNSEGTEDG